MTQNTPLPHGVNGTRGSDRESRYRQGGSPEAAGCVIRTIGSSVLQDGAPHAVPTSQDRGRYRIMCGSGELA